MANYTMPIFAREETLYRMKTLLHKALLYIAVYIICAVVLCLVLCNIAYCFIPSSHAYMKWIEAAAFVLAAICVILFVRCRPLIPQEKKELSNDKGRGPCGGGMIKNQSLRCIAHQRLLFVFWLPAVRPALVEFKQ